MTNEKKQNNTLNLYNKIKPRAITWYINRRKLLEKEILSVDQAIRILYENHANTDMDSDKYNKKKTKLINDRNNKENELADIKTTLKDKYGLEEKSENIEYSINESDTNDKEKQSIEEPNVILRNMILLFVSKSSASYTKTDNTVNQSMLGDKIHAIADEINILFDIEIKIAAKTATGYIGKSLKNESLDNCHANLLIGLLIFGFYKIENKNKNNNKLIIQGIYDYLPTLAEKIIQNDTNIDIVNIKIVKKLKLSFEKIIK